MYLLLIYFFILIIPIIVMPGAIKAGKLSPYRVVMYSAITIAAATVVIFMIASMTGKGIFAQIKELVDVMAKDLAQNPMVADAFDLAAVGEAERTEMFKNLYNSTFAVMPACIMILGMVVSYIEYIIIAKIMGRRTQVSRMPKLREFSWPNGAFMAVMGMYLISWILTQTGVFGDNMIYMNVDLLFNFVFSVQGVSVVLMFCHMKRIPKPIGVVIAIVMWMIYLGRLVLLMVGMFDLIFGIKGKIQGRSARR